MDLGGDDLAKGHEVAARRSSTLFATSTSTRLALASMGRLLLRGEAQAIWERKKRETQRGNGKIS